MKLGLGVWQGTFERITRTWLRWYDEQGDWVLTDTEQERQEKELALERAAQVETQLRQVALNLLQTGMSTSQVAQLTGLSEEQVRELTR